MQINKYKAAIACYEPSTKPTDPLVPNSLAAPSSPSTLSSAPSTEPTPLALASTNSQPSLALPNPDEPEQIRQARYVFCLFASLSTLPAFSWSASTNHLIPAIVYRAEITRLEDSIAKNKALTESLNKRLDEIQTSAKVRLADSHRLVLLLLLTKVVVSSSQGLMDDLPSIIQNVALRVSFFNILFIFCLVLISSSVLVCRHVWSWSIRFSVLNLTN